MKTQFIEIHWSAPNVEEARRIARALIERHLVACATLLPQAEALFIWQGELSRAEEVFVIFKTRADHFEMVRREILAETSYLVPEILELPILRGHEEYLDWVDHATS